MLTVAKYVTITLMVLLILAASPFVVML